MNDVDPEDRKLVVLARATRGRTGAAQGAAIRDLDGRTYAAATVDLPHLKLPALAACVAMAVAGGSTGVAAAVVMGDEPVDTPGIEALVDLAGVGVVLHRVNPAGTVVATSTT